MINNKVIVAKHIDVIEESVNLVGFIENEEVNEVKSIESEINKNIHNKSDKNQNIEHKLLLQAQVRLLFCSEL